MYTDVDACIRWCLWRLGIGCLSQLCLCHIILKQGLLPTLKLLASTSPTGLTSAAIFLSLPPLSYMPGLQVHTAMPDFFCVDTGDLNSGPQACLATLYWSRPWSF